MNKGPKGSLKQCTFTNHMAAHGCVVSGHALDDILIDECDDTCHTTGAFYPSVRDGGGAGFIGSNTKITHAVFDSNFSNKSGRALKFTLSTPATIQNSKIVNHTAEAVFTSGNLYLLNNTSTGNDLGMLNDVDTVINQTDIMDSTTNFVVFGSCETVSRGGNLWTDASSDNHLQGWGGYPTTARQGDSIVFLVRQELSH
jgi:hypothetical protein